MSGKRVRHWLMVFGFTPRSEAISVAPPSAETGTDGPESRVSLPDATVGDVLHSVGDCKAGVLPVVIGTMKVLQ